MKITTYNKKHIPEIKNQYYRNGKGRFTSRGLHIAVYLFVILGILTIAFLSQTQKKVEYVDKITVIDTTKEIIEKEKTDILDTLEQCESKGDANAIVWVDGGYGKNAGSFGAYQFKVGTIQLFIKDLTDFQAIALASDKAESRKLAEKIIFETKDGIYNWKLCMIKNNLLSRVNFVKELESKLK